MLVHHLLSWTVGTDRARHLLGGASGFAVTDLAAPMFTVAAGAAAALTARRLRATGGRGLPRVLLRWVYVALWGVALDVVTDGQLDSFGVLQALAAAGVVVTLVMLVLAPRPGSCVAAVFALTACSGRIIVIADRAGGPWAVVFGGQFPAASYLALAGAGAAGVAILGTAERGRQLAGVALATVVLWTTLGWAGVHVWPPDRYPSGPAFIVPGVVGTMALWAGLSELRPSRFTDAVARSGRRTLLVFVGHYGIRLVLDAGGWAHQLHGAGWAAGALAVAGLIAAVSALPRQPIRALDVGQTVRNVPAARDAVHQDR